MCIYKAMKLVSNSTLTLTRTFGSAANAFPVQPAAKAE